MEKEVDKIAEHMVESGAPGKNSKLTNIAINIADLSLRAYSGELLDRGLDISKAIVAFEDELIKSTKEVTK